MLQYVQIISVPTADSPGPCVLLHFDSRRYVFGHMSEGMQRIMAQRRVALSKLDEVFLSGPTTWKNVGGLLGMILTIADVVATQKLPDESNKKKKKKAEGNLSTIASLKIYGAENIAHMVATSRRFIFRKGLPLRLHEIPHESARDHQQGRKPDFEDANVRVWYVSLKPAAETTKPHGRKRSHDDMVAEGTQGQGQVSPMQDAEKKQAARELVKSVVDNMFDSEWELDALEESTLYQVKLPAAIFVKGEDGQMKKYEGPMPGDDEAVPDIQVFTRRPWPAVRIAELPRTSPSTQSLCYIVKGQARRGKFDVQAAERLGVQRWDYKLLTSGKTVKGKDDMDVTPDMVLAPAVEGRGFAFIDLPDASYISEFLARPEWSDDSLMGTLDVMYWNLGRGVQHDERIKEFMEARGDMTHTVFSPDTNPNGIAMHGAANSMVRMHRIDPDRFGLPVFDNKPKGPATKALQVAQVGAKLIQSPRVEVKDDEILQPMDLLGAVQSIDPKVIEMADKAKAKSEDPALLAEIEAAEKDIPNRDLEVIALGTGSALPSKYRNVSATLIRVPGYGSYLFDCGENTLGQLRRMYGYDKADEILGDLKVIWISHLHADHHLGTASVIRAWNEVTTTNMTQNITAEPTPRLTVVSTPYMLDWLREYADVEDFGFDRLRLISIRGPQQREAIQDPVIFDATSLAGRDTGLARIDACRVDHCYGALACVFTWPSGLKVAYSGDCRPSDGLVRIGRGCTLLLHESTLDDELRDDAYAKKHCTMSEALDVARRMQARRVLLTHFSQRYPKIGNSFTADGRSKRNRPTDQVVLMAFDMMRVKLGDFRKAELFLPALRKMLVESDEDAD
ncbi:hypothetical protein M406DRAFT_284266 [Cryphonectria parasitica EP155]|uniref:ribonuclease Z n=1 Tax=Cryphonectria parasitica (strain ATCC 38755 / EP155) TaxID=660469 RepID=A0A9P4YAJ0_CRYP1|nr:uncharacterized protein M406DRAFT_284266 [Cryphonectria parasitica EP155]KAF3769813.1 hypothetical protein M406DRAFT_284266 [Cryphonectria parasitica EP155]